MSNVSWDPISAEKGEYRHFMHKEIHEQVRSLTDTIAGRVDFDEGRIRLPEMKLTPERARQIKNLYNSLWHCLSCWVGRKSAN